MDSEAGYFLWVDPATSTITVPVHTYIRFRIPSRILSLFLFAGIKPTTDAFVVLQQIRIVVHFTGKEFHRSGWVIDKIDIRRQVVDTPVHRICVQRKVQCETVLKRVLFQDRHFKAAFYFLDHVEGRTVTNRIRGSIELFVVLAFGNRNHIHLTFKPLLHQQPIAKQRRTRCHKEGCIKKIEHITVHNLISDMKHHFQWKKGASPDFGKTLGVVSTRFDPTNAHNTCRSLFATLARFFVLVGSFAMCFVIRC